MTYKNKFIIYDYTELGDISVMEIISDVMKQGLISNNNTEYCYATRFGGKGVVEMIKTKYGYKILVLPDNKSKLLKEEEWRYSNVD